MLILDGASEPLGGRPTSLELARTPALDKLCASGALDRLKTIPDGLPVGTETAVPGLLGWTPSRRVDRAMLEAAAHDVVLARGDRAWRIDVIDDEGGRAREPAIGVAATRLRIELDRHQVRRIGAHRLLVTGPPPLRLASRSGLRLWPEGALPPRIFDHETVVICAIGAVAGLARLMGASVVIPIGATGWIDSDFAAKATAASEAIARGARQVVIHVGAPDEAAHRLDPTAKIAVLERIDRELVTSLSEAVRSADGTLTVLADHGCDPRTGRHCGDPVPRLVWPVQARQVDATRRLNERVVAQLPVALSHAWEAA